MIAKKAEEEIAMVAPNFRRSDPEEILAAPYFDRME
jgi:hypothetical protein